MRALLLLTVVYGSLPFILQRPYLGLLVFSWLAFMRPHDYAWLAKPESLSLYVALAMVAGLVLNVGRERFVRLRATTWVLILLGLWFAITGLTAIDTDLAKPWVEQFGKIVLVAILTTGLVGSAERCRGLMLVTAFSLGLLGLKFALHGVAKGDPFIHQGPGGFMIDNNGFALALAMGLPLLVAIATGDRSRAVRLAAGVMVPFTMLTIVFTLSRGGFLTMAVVGLLLVVRSGRPRLAVLLVVAALIGLFTLASPDFRQRYLARASSIADYDTDESAAGRIAAWETALRMSRDHPWLGVGPDNFQTMYPFYAGPNEMVRVTHNSYLQFLSENGWPAMLLFIALQVLALASLERVRRGRVPPWLAGYASGIQIALVGFVVGGFFLDMAYFDLFYHLVAFSVCLRMVAAEESEESTTPEAGAEATPWWKQAAAS